MLLIQITKRADGAGLLRCIRADGSVTWQKQNNRIAPFFALHDLTHFAVESTLGSRRGFYGLIAEGWDEDDTTGKGARGPLPDEAREVESIVGLLDAERASGALMTADELNQFLSMQSVSRRLTPEELNSVRALRAKLFARWFDLPPGETLELRFEL